MPYISQDRRDELEPYPVYKFEAPQTPGELNFVLTCEFRAYLQRKGRSYATMNEILGVLEAVKLEFYRRVIAPYENEKCEQNGDVY